MSSAPGQNLPENQFLSNVLSVLGKKENQTVSDQNVIEKNVTQRYEDLQTITSVLELSD